MTYISLIGIDLQLLNRIQSAEKFICSLYLKPISVGKHLSVKIFHTKSILAQIGPLYYTSSHQDNYCVVRGKTVRAEGPRGLLGKKKKRQYLLEMTGSLPSETHRSCGYLNKTCTRSNHLKFHHGQMSPHPYGRSYWKLIVAQEGNEVVCCGHGPFWWPMFQ